MAAAGDIGKAVASVEISGLLVSSFVILPVIVPLARSSSGFPKRERNANSSMIEILRMIYLHATIGIVKEKTSYNKFVKIIYLNCQTLDFQVSVRFRTVAVSYRTADCFKSFFTPPKATLGNWYDCWMNNVVTYLGINVLFC